MNRKKVIIITDGDKKAAAAVRQAAFNIGGTLIEASIGIPTTGDRDFIFEQILKAKEEPVLVLADDKGWQQKGRGETLISELIYHPQINVLGIVAVASDTVNGEMLHISHSIDNHGNIVSAAVNKSGEAKADDELIGDTIGVIRGKKYLKVIGMGDPGKMTGYDEPNLGSPITTKAIEYILGG